MVLFVDTGTHARTHTHTDRGNPGGLRPPWIASLRGLSPKGGSDQRAGQWNAEKGKANGMSDKCSPVTGKGAEPLHSLRPNNLIART